MSKMSEVRRNTILPIIIFFIFLGLLPIKTVAQTTRGVFYSPPKGMEKGLDGETEIYHHSFAVVIGIDHYSDPQITTLTGAVRDAKRVAEVFEDLGMSVKTFIDNEEGIEATQRNIKGYLGDILPGLVNTEDRVIVYFAGHGVSTGDGESSMGYLLPVDANKNMLRSTGIPMQEIQSWFQDYRAKHVMFVADACYSGLAINTRATSFSEFTYDYLKNITSHPVRIALVAGGAGEEANEWRGQGLFTYYFLEAIGGRADTNHDGLITSDEIAAYVKPNVSQTAMIEYQASQNPQMGRRGEGEFIFLNPNRGSLIDTQSIICSEGFRRENGKCISEVVESSEMSSSTVNTIPYVNSQNTPLEVSPVDSYDSDMVDHSLRNDVRARALFESGRKKIIAGRVIFGFGLGTLVLGGISTGLAAANGSSCESTSDSACDRSRAWAGVMWASYGIGTLLTTTGIVFWAVGSKENKIGHSSISLAPIIGGDRFSLSIVGRW